MLPDRSTVRLTALMRKALTDAAKPGGVERRHPEPNVKPPWPHPPATLAALLRRELVEHSVDGSLGYWVERWVILEAGREALKPVEVFKVEPLRYLVHAGRERYKTLPGGRQTVDERDLGSGDYTTDRHRSFDELPALDPPSPEWARRAEARRVRDHAWQESAARLGRALRRAA